MKALTRLITLVFALFVLLSSASARADLIKQGGSYNRTVLMTSTSDHISGATALTLAVKIAKAGGAFAAITPTVTEQGNGRYNIALVAANLDTLGALDLQVTASGADPSDTHDQVIAFDPNDPAALGLTRLDVAVSSRNAVTPPALPSTYPLSATDELLLGYLYSMVDPNAGTPRYKATSLALAPTGSGGAVVDPFASVTSTSYAAGTFGSLFKTSLANPVPLPGDFVNALFATSRWQRLEAVETGNFVRNPATGVITLTRQDGTTLTITTSVDGQGRITGKTVSP